MQKISALSIHCVNTIVIPELAVERLLLALARVGRRGRLVHAGRHRVVAHGEGGGEPVRRHLPRRNVVHVEAAVLVVSATASSASAAATEAVVRPDAVVVLARYLALHPEMSILGRFGSFLGQCRDSFRVLTPIKVVEVVEGRFLYRLAARRRRHRLPSSSRSSQRRRS